MDAYTLWARDNASELASVLDPNSPTNKHFAFLALLEGRDRAWTYSDLAASIDAHAVRPEFGFDTAAGHAALRVALAELSRLLDRSGAHWRIKHWKDGRIARFQLVKIDQLRSTLRDGADEVPIWLGPSVMSADGMVAELLERQRLPFHAFYILPRAAANWMSLTAGEEDDRNYWDAAILQGKAWQGWSAEFLGGKDGLKGVFGIKDQFAAGGGCPKRARPCHGRGRGRTRAPSGHALWRRPTA